MSNTLLPRIVNAMVCNVPRQHGRMMVVVLLENCAAVDPGIRWYADELTFSADEFLGKTVNEALELHRRKDVAYLQS